MMTHQTFMYLYIYLCIYLPSMFLSQVCIPYNKFYTLLLIYYIHVEYSDNEWKLKRIFDSERHWYKTQVIKYEEEEEKGSFDMREKDMKLTSLQSSESSLKYTIHMFEQT